MSHDETLLRIDPARLPQARLAARVAHFAELGSTNDHALQLARRGAAPAPLLVTADRQTAGRGRGSNRWFSAPGGLTFSVLEQPPATLPRQRWPLMAIVTGLALCELLDRHLDGTPDRPGVRWPNDVFVGERKLAGVLIEVVPGASPAADQVVIGVGLNVNNDFAEAPDEVRRRAASLAELAGRRFDLTELLGGLLIQLDRELTALYEGSSQLANRWQARCLLRGRTVTLEQGNRTVVGLCQGMAADGTLAILGPAGVEHFVGGVLRAVD